MPVAVPQPPTGEALHARASLALLHGLYQVSSAWCKPLNEMVAIKILDLERQDPGKLVRAALPGGRGV